jgi:ubiquinone/menaquinone biosynthesis C-methylase UbiE
MDPETITRRTYDRIAIEYSRHTLSSRVRLAIRPSLLQFGRLMRPGGRVLIVGAGDGRDGFSLRACGIQPLYLDYSHAMNMIIARKDPNALIVTADMRMLPFTAGSFDGAWASMCLYHLRQSSLRMCLADIHRVLLPGGLFYFNVRPGRGQRMMLHPWSFPHGGPRLYTRYSPHQVISLLSGFELIRIQEFDRNLGRHLIQVWLRRPTAHGAAH